MSSGEPAFGKGGASPKHTRKNAGALANFSEGNFYKQVVSFQSNRGQLYNDTSILKNSISQVQRRCDRQAFMKAKMDIVHSQQTQGSKLSAQTMGSGAGVATKAPVEGQRNAGANNGFTFGQPRTGIPGNVNEYSMFKESNSDHRSNGQGSEQKNSDGQIEPKRCQTQETNLNRQRSGQAEADACKVGKLQTHSSIYGEAHDQRSSKNASPGKVQKMRPGTNSQNSGAHMLDYMNTNSEQRVFNDGDIQGGTAYNGFPTQPPMSLMVSTHNSGFGGRPIDTDAWCNSSSVFLQKGVPAPTYARTSKSRDQQDRGAAARAASCNSNISFNATQGQGSFSKTMHDQALAFRAHAGLQSSMDSRKNYLKNRANGKTTNECFIAPGGKPASHMKLTATMPPSRVGKPTNFFSLREQMGSAGASLAQVPNKNERSLSFAVDESKVQRRHFGFQPKNMLLREKGLAAIKQQGEQQQRFSEMTNSAINRQRHANRHMSRNDGVSHSIDFINHTEVRGPRSASDGGFFQMGYSGQSARAVKRLGTAETGHGRQFLITDFTKNQKDPHFNQRYDQIKPRAFSFKRSEFQDIINAQGATNNVIRPSEFTFKQMRQPIH